MELSYWEIKSWITNVDFTIIGSGIVGLNCALQLKKNHPEATVLIIEQGLLPQGASTKNAGFACFGSISELLEDLNNHTEDEVFQLVEKRIKGLEQLRNLLGDNTINYKQYGGYELFNDDELYTDCYDRLEEVNQFLNPIFNDAVFSFKANTFGFNNIKDQYAFNKYEGQIDTGKMMAALINKVQKAGVKILNNTKLTEYSENTSSVTLRTNHFEFKSKTVFIATNGFAQQMLNEDVKPARAQVLITKPIKDLHIKGTFHLDRGYYYFRNIDDRVLFGGGRNLDFETETTTKFGLTSRVQDELEAILKHTILPNKTVEIEHRWSGIMGVGSQKKAIVKALSDHVYCGVRLGGMGVAIGSTIGTELANLIE